MKEHYTNSLYIVNSGLAACALLSLVMGVVLGTCVIPCVIVPVGAIVGGIHYAAWRKDRDLYIRKGLW